MSAEVSQRRNALKIIEQRSPIATEIPTEKLESLFGQDVFGDRELRERLPESSYKAFRAVLGSNSTLEPNLADQIANAMKTWAVEHGATHFTHWFQPMTGQTAEKHDSFLNFDGDKLVMQFSGKELIKGEPDASSFPNGGMRSTFEARGYTAWDMSSPAFIRNGKNGRTLCIPTAFCSWAGEALDEKTPLLRSRAAINREATRLMNLLGFKDVISVHTTLGAEQEYFLIDRAFYLARPDLVTCGRTVIGAKPPKGQELEDHYFGAINRRVLSFMQDVELQLWRLGVPVKTRHNEVAPGQYEAAPIFEAEAQAADHNMLTMEIMRETAERHGFACLLHEKPFAGVNGSGKHNNWSMSTNTGINLLDPGKTPGQNARFLVFLAATIRAVDTHADLLRCSIVTPGNDHRLGANEAPPAIMSVYLGSELDSVCQTLIKQATYTPQEALTLTLGVNSLPPLPRDSTDRNRTSPFAFTGNKFEFRAVGSSQTVARPLFILNTAAADSIRLICDEIEELMKEDGRTMDSAVQTVVQRTLEKHYRVVFNENSYSQDWVEEAARRGLANHRTTPDALSQWASEKNLKLFEESGVLSRKEWLARGHILHENYVKALVIEGQVGLSMVQTQVLPACIRYQRSLAESIRSVRDVLGGEEGAATVAPQVAQLKQLTTNINALIAGLEGLRKALDDLDRIECLEEQTKFARFNLFQALGAVRESSDALEAIVDDAVWPIPKYSEMLFLR